MRQVRMQRPWQLGHSLKLTFASLLAVSQKRAVHEFFHGRPIRISLAVVGGSIGVLTQCFLSAHAGVVSPFLVNQRGRRFRQTKLTKRLQLIPQKPWRIVFYVWMGLLMATEVVGYVGQFVGAIRDLRGLPDRPFTSQVGTTFSIWLWASATADISISLVCASSLKSRLHGYTREVDSLLHRLVIICFRTAAYTSLMAIVAAILATIYHANFTLHLYITLACVSLGRFMSSTCLRDTETSISRFPFLQVLARSARVIRHRTFHLFDIESRSNQRSLPSS